MLPPHQWVERRSFSSSWLSSAESKGQPHRPSHQEQSVHIYGVRNCRWHYIIIFSVLNISLMPLLTSVFMRASFWSISYSTANVVWKQTNKFNIHTVSQSTAHLLGKDIKSFIRFSEDLNLYVCVCMRVNYSQTQFVCWYLWSEHLCRSRSLKEGTPVLPEFVEPVETYQKHMLDQKF